MGLLDWWRRKRETGASPDGPSADVPETLPMPAVRPAPQPFWCDWVELDDTSCLALSKRGPELRIDFADLEEISILTTDEGPGAEDVFWQVSTAASQIVVPHGAPGEAELFERFLKLPGFHAQTMIDAMTCSENRIFDCWKRPD